MNEKCEIVLERKTFFCARLFWGNNGTKDKFRFTTSDKIYKFGRKTNRTGISGVKK